MTLVLQEATQATTKASQIRRTRLNLNRQIGETVVIRYGDGPDDYLTVTIGNATRGMRVVSNDEVAPGILPPGNPRICLVFEASQDVGIWREEMERKESA